MQGVLPQKAIADVLKQHFVGLASDCDAPEREIIALAQEHMADAMMLPFVFLVDADGRFLAGSHGAVRPDRLAAMLAEATG